MALRERESLLEERCAALQSALELKGQELNSALQGLTRSSEEAQRMQDEARQVGCSRKGKVEPCSRHQRRGRGDMHGDRFSIQVFPKAGPTPSCP